MKFVNKVSGILFHSVGVTLKAPPNLQATSKASLSIDQAQKELHHNKYFNARFQRKHALMTNKLYKSLTL